MLRDIMTMRAGSGRHMFELLNDPNSPHVAERWRSVIFT